MRNISALILVLLLLCLEGAGKGRPKVRYIESEKRDGYVCHLIEYMVDGNIVPAYLLIPDGKGMHPGIVLLHDHGARFDIGKEKLVRPLSSAPENVRLSSEQWINDNFDGVWFADKLAAEGYAVIVPDAFYWGDRSSEACRKWSRVRFLGECGDLKALKDEVYEGQRAVFDSLQRQGVIWAEMTLREDSAAAEILTSLRNVDCRRIGAFGWSMGAHRAWLAGAFSDRIKSGCALSWMTLKSRVSVPYSASEYSMYIPRLRDSMDFPDIAKLLVPKHFLFLSGTSDRLFPADAVEECYDRMQESYAGHPGRLVTLFYDGPHHCGKDLQQMIIRWFKMTL